MPDEAFLLLWGERLLHRLGNGGNPRIARAAGPRACRRRQAQRSAGRRAGRVVEALAALEERPTANLHRIPMPR